MGTRNLTLVWYKGKFVIAQYGQWDGHPEGQGETALKFLLNPDNITKLIAALDNGIIFEASPDEIKKMADEAMEQQLRGQPVTIIESLNRDTAAKILNLVATSTKPIPVQLEVDFAFNTIMCEFAYAIDLDARRFEMYSSWENMPSEVGVKLDGPTQLQLVATKAGRKMLDLIAVYPFDALPDVDDFLTDVERVNDEEEEDDEDGGLGGKAGHGTEDVD